MVIINARRPSVRPFSVGHFYPITSNAKYSVANTASIAIKNPIPERLGTPDYYFV